MITGRDAPPGTLKRVAIEKNIPAKNIFLYVGEFNKIKKAAIVGPIIKSSALTVFPSKSGIVVKIAKVIVAIFCKISRSKSLVVNFQNRIKVTTIQKAKITLNQKRLPAIAAKI